MKITWYGTASLILQSGGSSIAFDPYLKQLPKDYEPKGLLENRIKAFKGQKSIFITHGHFDHLSSIKTLYKDSECKVYLSKTPYRTLKRRGVPKTILQKISAGEEIKVGDINVHVLKGKHIQFEWLELAKGFVKPKPFKDVCRGLARTFDHLKHPERGETLFYEIKAENKLIQIMGSAELADNVEYKTGADLLIIPHQGRGTMDEHNARIVNLLKPKRVLLDHYDDAFPPYSRLVPVDDFCTETSKTIPTEKLIEGQTIEI